MPYDPNARRDTPLALKLKERIRREGPITVEAYMQACLQDPEHGYYVTQRAIGRDGDFITAPEISQVFGELIGLWAAVVWKQMGSPERIKLVELGPGRGTLMRDALRAARLVPGFLNAIGLYLVESSACLKKAQAEALEGANARWLTQLVQIAETEPHGYASQPSLPLQPTIVIANEFLDALPVRQIVRHDGLWFERTVDTGEDGALRFARSETPARGVGSHAAAPACDDIIEIAPPIGDLTVPLGQIAEQAPVAALFIDYGTERQRAGETLQAVRNHAAEHPLTSPGEADLTAHVNFAALTRSFSASGFDIDGPLTQAEFLGRLGIVERASRLMSANPAKAGAIEMDVARLIAPQGMGSRFKVLGVRSKGLSALPGLEHAAA